MTHWEVASFAKDLSEFIGLIDKYEIPIESSKLYNLESQFQYQKTFQVEIKEVFFNIQTKISGTIPTDVERVSVSFSHICELDKHKDISNQDPVKSNYYFFIEINGYDDKDNRYINCWRLDQNEYGVGQHKQTHPYYHFQSGGDELAEIDCGKVIFLSAPRLPHPPMDLFLGIHFILHNFFSIKDYPNLKLFFEDYQYQEIIKRAQQRMWKSYFDSFKDNNNNTDFTFSKVFPLYIH